MVVGLTERPREARSQTCTKVARFVTDLIVLVLRARVIAFLSFRALDRKKNLLKKKKKKCLFLNVTR